MKNIEIQIPILNNEYEVSVLWGDRSFLKDHIGKRFKKGDLKKNVGITYTKKNKPPVIALRGYPETPEEVSVLAHESAHAVRHIFRTIKEKKGEEIFAHSVGAVVRGVLELGVEKEL